MRKICNILALLVFFLAAPAVVRAMPWEEMVLGRADAPVTIIEYSSLTCPHCATFHAETLPLIVRDYIDTGKARLLFRDFPFDRVALLGAVLARCSGRDSFYGFLEVLFRTQETWAGSGDPVAELRKVARMGGLSGDRFDACVADDELIDGILEKRKEAAEKHGIESTPNFLINGTKLTGAQPFEKFREAIEAALAAAKR